MSRKGLSPKRLAALSGLSRQAIYTLLRRGTLPSLEALWALCPALDVLPSELLTLGEEVAAAGGDFEVFDREADPGQGHGQVGHPGGPASVAAGH